VFRPSGPARPSQCDLGTCSPHAKCSSIDMKWGKDPHIQIEGAGSGLAPSPQRRLPPMSTALSFPQSVRPPGLTSGHLAWRGPAGQACSATALMLGPGVCRALSPPRPAGVGASPNPRISHSRLVAAGARLGRASVHLARTLVCAGYTVPELHASKPNQRGPRKVAGDDNLLILGRAQ
jgi:hypothetical protein